MTSTLSNGSKMRLVGLLAALITLIAAGAGPYVDEAKAYGNVGKYAPAEVVCDTLHELMLLRPHFGASRALSSQWLSYRYYIFNIDTGRGTFTNWSPTFQHSAVYVTGAITEYRDWAYVVDWYYAPGPGRFKVRTDYAWFDGGWFYRSAWTTGYDGVYFDGGGAYCRTTSVAG